MSINKKALEFYSTQSINNLDKESILGVLGSDYLSRGPKIQEFEDKLGKLCNNKYSVSLNSATSALQLAYQVNEIQKGDLVWTTPITFVATSNAALHFGANIDFIDINPETLNICPNLLEAKLKKAKFASALPDFLTVVHFGGSPCEMETIYDLSIEYGFKIIEDASHALGSSYKNKMIGENNFSLASVFSFHPVKMITTGEGGAILLNSEKDQEKVRSLRSHGIVSTKSLEMNKRPGWYYEQVDLGYNFRMSELQAALGSSQIERLEHFIKKRNTLAKYYKKHLSKLPFKFQKILKGCNSSYHLFTVELTDKNFSRDELYRFLKGNKIGCQVHYIPVHLQPYYKRQGFSEGMFQNAENYFRNCLSLPLHQALQETDIQYVCDKLTDFFAKS